MCKNAETSRCVEGFCFSPGRSRPKEYQLIKLQRNDILKNQSNSKLMIMTKQPILVMITTLFVILMASSEAIGADWLVGQIKEPVEIEKHLDGREIVLSNSLISRKFRLGPNAATVAYDNLITGKSIIRGIKPEATVELDGQKYDVGGLQGQLE